MLLKDYFIKLYQRANFINKLIKTQQFCKQGPIHFIPILGVAYKHSDSFNYSKGQNCYWKIKSGLEISHTELLWHSKFQHLEILYICCKLSGFPNNSHEVCFIKLKIDILYHINNTFRDIAFQMSIAVLLHFCEWKSRKMLQNFIQPKFLRFNYTVSSSSLHHLEVKLLFFYRSQTKM